ncbi:hypothetical protein PGT21_018138 [Puccinia graminis f. sp. tritici]|uniref:Uncharacterized protein n=1 Tax=Puccinia graminis f. sp. tritici TaxID=56615 RepID=A0A5B0MNA1_PUCGR|nr:hypothetical protein PGT21_018138 [Puccinia graminis f. sp. tritici]
MHDGFGLASQSVVVDSDTGWEGAVIFLATRLALQNTGCTDSEADWALGNPDHGMVRLRNWTGRGGRFAEPPNISYRRRLGTSSNQLVSRPRDSRCASDFFADWVGVVFCPAGWLIL